MATVNSKVINCSEDNGGIIVRGSADELEKVVAFVNNMYDASCEEIDDNEHDAVRHPSHYSHGIECIDEMILLYGKWDTMAFCKLNSHKYRKRALDKGGKEDIEKSDWYMKEYAYLETKSEIELKNMIYKKYNLNQPNN